MAEKKKKLKVPLYLRILIGMFLGVIWGLLVSDFHWGIPFTKDYIKPFGTIFINLLKMTAIPIILSSLITGVASLTDLKKLGKIGGFTIVLFLCTALIATSLGVMLAGMFGPGKGFSNEIRETLSSKYAPVAENTLVRVSAIKESGPLQPLVEMVPENITRAASDNINMLQVVIFALLLGIAILHVSLEKAKPLLSFFESLNAIMIKLVGIIMKLAPVGVFALLASVLVDIAGENSSQAYQFLLALLSYSLTVVAALLIMLFVVYPSIVVFFSKVGYMQFFKAMQPAFLLGFSTSSSSATLPVTMERVEKHLGVPEHVTGFVLPFGTTINMDGTALYQSIAVVFVAQVLGLDLTIFQLITVVLTATLAAAGAAGIPGAGMVTLVAVLESAGVPSAIGIALITPPDRILDMCRTVINVAGDAVAAVVISSAVEADPEPPNINAETPL